MSIRARLLWLALLAAMLPALLIAARFAQTRDDTIAAETARLAFIAQRRAETINERIRGTAQLHQGLARARDLQTDDRDACSAFLGRILEANPQYTGLLTIRPDGRLFCDSLRSGRDLDLRDRAYFKAAIEARDQVVVEPVFGRLTGRAVLQIAYPARSDSGELQFIMLASLNLQALIERDRLPVAGSRLLLLDTRGTLLARSDASTAGETIGDSLADTPLFRFAADASGPTTSEFAGPGGQPHVWARPDAASLAGTGLLMVADAPREVVLAPADRRFREDIALLAAYALAWFLALVVLAETSIRRPVARLTTMARQMAAGDLHARIAEPLPRGELGTLMAVLNQTAASLQRQRDDIEQLHGRLRQSQRLEAVGQLTGGLAHDFNNLLTVVLGNAELLAEQHAPRTPQRQLAEMISAAAQRGAELTQRLLAFARKQPLNPQPTDLNQLVAGLDPMLRRTLGEHIEIELIRGAGLWPALADPGQVENALLNLCLNARDAMAGGGRLTLETANARLDQPYADQHGDVEPGQYVMLAVSDTGTGIPPDLLPRVFDPFFTTKETGKGTGLGLAMVYGFVKQSAGHVAIYSEPGQGTTVKLYLPRALGEQPPAPEPAIDAALTGGSETVLLVEDDEAVRRYAAEQLRALGYRVVEAHDGASALALVEQRDDIDLLFTDVVMPGGMNGRALADAALRVRPGLGVLFTSGYTENAIVHHGRLDPGAQLLTKPYRRADLGRAIRVALGRRPAST